jgi:hypothetical protein
MSAQVPFSDALRLDAELVRLARGASVLRLAVGEALDALWSSEGHYELGFSSFEAYARERCERTGRWAADSRALARKLVALPRMRAALQAGAIGWSTAELLARHATAESEVAWLEKARRSTVRELRKLLAQGGGSEDDVELDEPTEKLTVSGVREDGWLFEAARKVAEVVAGPLSADRLLQALLAEGYSTLLELVPKGSMLDEIDALEATFAGESEAQAAWCAERRRWREEAEVTCERRTSSEDGVQVSVNATSESSRDLLAVSVGSKIAGALSVAPGIDGRRAELDASGACRSHETERPTRARAEPPEAIDGAIRRRCAELAERDLALGSVAERARTIDLWRRLGFASEAQYARERVGVSLSSIKAKRLLAARAGRLPELATALSSGRIGYEAAYLLSRVVTPKTAAAWVSLAERRTIKHLREEVEAAELMLRVGREREPLPLDDQSLDAVFELERCIVSGELFDNDGDEPSSVAAARNERPRSQTSGSIAAGATVVSSPTAGRWRHGVGHVTLRWNVTQRSHRLWRALERVFVRVSGWVCRRPVSFLRFLCENFCRI